MDFLFFSAAKTLSSTDFKVTFYVDQLVVPFICHLTFYVLQQTGHDFLLSDTSVDGNSDKIPIHHLNIKHNATQH